MAHCCSQCSFAAKFESALKMHHQLHHESTSSAFLEDKPDTIAETTAPISFARNKEGKEGTRSSSSATRLLDKLKSKIIRSRSRTLFSHPEESDCTGHATQDLSNALTKQPMEIYGCHLCSFNADRITTLDRHLLNDHKIGLENLLKLVLEKTKDGLSEDTKQLTGIRQAYYSKDEIVEDTEFFIQTVSPKIKILKHASTNTEIQWMDIQDLKDCKKNDKGDLLEKMQTLSDCMCKFVESTNTIKQVLTKQLDMKTCVRQRMSTVEPIFDLGLGDQDTPRNWEKAQSENMPKGRNNLEDTSGENPKFSSESFYF